MIRVRKAAARDVAALAALCRAAVGPDDYVLAFLEEMVAAGQIFFIPVRGRAAAMMGVTFCLDRALWIGQMRTHPEERRCGHARRLLDAAWGRAVRERRPGLRLWTSERNTAGRGMAEAAGFRHVATFTRVRARALTAGGDATGSLRPARDLGAVLRGFHAGLLGRRGNGYLAYRHHFIPLTVRTLDALARNGQVLGGSGSALVWWPSEGPAFGVSVLAGGVPALRAARLLAGREERHPVEIFLPRDGRILDRARAAGFTRASWGRHAYLYEKAGRSVRGPRAAAAWTPR